MLIATQAGRVSQMLHRSALVDKTMTLFEWIDLAATLGIDGLEFYSGFLHEDEAFLEKVKAALERHNWPCPCSAARPTSPSQIRSCCKKRSTAQKRMIEITAFFGGGFCRVLSGQRRPD